MDASEFIEIGILIRPHGLKGNIELKLNYPIKDISALASLFLEELPIPLPYFISEISPLSKQGHYTVKLEDLNTPEEISLLKGKKLFFPKVNFKEAFEQKDFKYINDQLIDLNLFNSIGESIGVIEDVFENNLNQRILKVIVNNKEVLIPFIEDWILEFNNDNGTMKYDIPDGLLEIYLQ